MKVVKPVMVKAVVTEHAGPMKLVGREAVMVEITRRRMAEENMVIGW